jgi:hypothetical protein
VSVLSWMELDVFAEQTMRLVYWLIRFIDDCKPHEMMSVEWRKSHLYESGKY